MLKNPMGPSKACNYQQAVCFIIDDISVSFFILPPYFHRKTPNRQTFQIQNILYLYKNQLLIIQKSSHFKSGIKFVKVVKKSNRLNQNFNPLNFGNAH